MHPTVPLVLWGTLVGLTQLLPMAGLAVLASAAFLGAWKLAPSRFGLLLRRARWLLLSILMIFLFATPGLLLFPGLGRYGPTVDGAELGATHALRLLLVLAGLALLLHRLAIEELVAGLYGLLRPLRVFGLDRARVALRLILVLRYVEQAPHGGRWRDWLQGAGPATDTAPIRIGVAPLRAADVLALCCIGGAGAVAGWSLW